MTFLKDMQNNRWELLAGVTIFAMAAFVMYHLWGEIGRIQQEEENQQRQQEEGRQRQLQQQRQQQGHQHYRRQPQHHPQAQHQQEGRRGRRQKRERQPQPQPLPPRQNEAIGWKISFGRAFRKLRELTVPLITTLPKFLENHRIHRIQQIHQDPFLYIPYRIRDKIAKIGLILLCVVGGPIFAYHNHAAAVWIILLVPFVTCWIHYSWKPENFLLVHMVAFTVRWYDPNNTMNNTRRGLIVNIISFLLTCTIVIFGDIGIHYITQTEFLPNDQGEKSYPGTLPLILCIFGVPALHLVIGWFKNDDDQPQRPPPAHRPVRQRRNMDLAGARRRARVVVGGAGGIPLRRPGHPPPAKPYTLEVLPKISVTEDDIRVHKECPMCMGDLTLGETVIRLPCSHLYHDECIEQWLLDKDCKCPLCLYEFPTDDPIYNAAQKTRMQDRKPRYYRYEIQRTPIKELKQWLPPGDVFVAIEKRQLVEHLIQVGAIQIIEDNVADDDDDDDDDSDSESSWTNITAPRMEQDDASDTSTFREGQDVYYKKGTQRYKAKILKVHLDNVMDPFYTIFVDGREKQTDKHHLSIVRPSDQETE